MSKADDYQKQRRNTYGESPHSSRQNIAKGKRRQNRAVRRTLRQVLQGGVEGDVETVRQLAERKHKFEKVADEPLGTVLVRELVRDYVMGKAEECFFVKGMDRLRENYPDFQPAFNQAYQWFSRGASQKQLAQLARYK